MPPKIKLSSTALSRVKIANLAGSHGYSPEISHTGRDKGTNIQGVMRHITGHRVEIHGEAWAQNNSKQAAWTLKDPGGAIKAKGYGHEELAHHLNATHGKPQERVPSGQHGGGEFASGTHGAVLDIHGYKHSTDQPGFSQFRKEDGSQTHLVTLYSRNLAHGGPANEQHWTHETKQLGFPSTKAKVNARGVSGISLDRFLSDFHGRRG